jgi:methylenetetrahydrofolate dehydrogenase (NADP+)/methenyltetrahydrofolate cyclohydrolase|tara:strand:+ start:1008 stop:1877 length:870 start_codon:yes stop_codon:yes gene_type:complete
MILDGKTVSVDIKKDLHIDVLNLKRVHIFPSLAIILIGQKIGSLTYIDMKRRMCEELGIKMILFHFEEDIPEERILQKIQELNDTLDIYAILVQLPLPDKFDKEKIINMISYEKDVDGFHTMNAGKLFQNRETNIIPCTPLGCLELLDYYHIDVHGMNITIIGTSNLVGLPLSILLLQRGGTVTMCNIDTKDVKEHTLNADMVVACCGVPHLVKEDWIKEGVIIIDIGINKITDTSKKNGYRLVGDVDFNAVKSKCRYITPVPGGVGPMTVISLMKNIIRLSENTFSEL